MTVLRPIFCAICACATMAPPVFGSEDVERDAFMIACLADHQTSWEEFRLLSIAKEKGEPLPMRQEVAFLAVTVCHGKWMGVENKKRRADSDLRASLRLKGPAYACALDGGANPSDLAAEPVSEDTAVSLAVCQYLIESAPEHTKQAAEALRTCMILRLSQIDDGLSPASDIADAASASCRSEYDNLFRRTAFESGFYGDRTPPLDISKSALRDIALPLVLEMRVLAQRNSPRQTKAAKPKIKM